MNQLSQELSERLKAASDESIPLNEFVEAWLSRPFSLTPWAAWTLFSLIRHRPRQEFVAEIVKHRLGVKLEALAEEGYFAHPKGKGRGLVPGLEEWEYDLHGIGCCVTHRVSGESIDVDFFDESADWIALDFYKYYLSSLRTPELWEQRVIALHPGYDTVKYALDELLDTGLLEQHSTKEAARLAFDERAFSTLMNLFEKTRDENESLIRLAAVLGDAPLVKQLLKPEQVKPMIEQAATQVIEQREQFLAQQFEQSIDQTLALKGLQEHQSPNLDDYLKRTLNGEDSDTISTALKFIVKSKNVVWCPLIFDLMQRFDPTGGPNEFPQPEIWSQCLEFLLRHNYRFSETSESLREVHQYCLGEATLLALEFKPEYALTLFRKALRSTIPNNREIVAAVLAILDQPWSRRELLAALAESEEQEPTQEIRAAILQTHCNSAHQVVLNWEERNPREKEAGEWITVDEFHTRSIPHFLQWQMEERHDRVLPLRSVVPPEPESN
ncbi:hypothetical protein Pan241w_59970 [Gimesia alba]|uniref:DUF6896 domain-containing protein n=1 Tax=Gimesia alba TaxID=2527973 RepID=A0A517RPR0_9PLAN|nr:hypothetical protein [Gimesia alba]QDT45869.1 hypothetical protein Pan241w_59970 [Gimesia alba]